LVDKIKVSEKKHFYATFRMEWLVDAYNLVGDTNVSKISFQRVLISQSPFTGVKS